MYKLVSFLKFLKNLCFIQFKLQFVLAAVLAVANSAVVYSGLPHAGAYAGALPYAHAGYYGAPLHAPVAVNYALPPAREVQEAPIVEQTVEPVEQHGYSIRY